MIMADCACWKHRQNQYLLRGDQRPASVTVTSAEALEARAL